MPRTLYVKCTVVVPVEVPDDPAYNAQFDLVENHCPGTGLVGAALAALIEKHDAESTCWACSLDGECEIVPAPERPSRDPDPVHVRVIKVTDAAFTYDLATDRRRR